MDLFVLTKAPLQYISWPFAAGCAKTPWHHVPMAITAPCVPPAILHYIIVLRDSSGYTWNMKYILSSGRQCIKGRLIRFIIV